MTNLKIALTGAHGFCGRTLAERFIKEKHKVSAVPRELLLDQDALHTYFEKLQPNYIFHFASYGNMYDQKDEDEIFATNIIKTYFLLKASLSIPYSAFINVSTSSVYGEKTLPMNERDVLDPISFYGATKASAEYIARYFAYKYDKPIVSVRPFSITGVGEQKEHLIPTLIRSCLYNEKMKFVPHPTHDFIDIHDYIDAILQLCLHAKDFNGNVFNIGTGIYWTNQQVKEIVEKETKKKARITESSNMRDYDTNLWVSDPTKMKMLGWYPKKDLELSIKEMVEYEKANKKSASD
jgi:nucleoside-diphosphate-sugar epimerase